MDGQRTFGHISIFILQINGTSILGNKEFRKVETHWKELFWIVARNTIVFVRKDHASNNPSKHLIIRPLFLEIFSSRSRRKKKKI